MVRTAQCRYIVKSLVSHIPTCMAPAWQHLHDYFVTQKLIVRGTPSEHRIRRVKASSLSMIAHK